MANGEDRSPLGPQHSNDDGGFGETALPGRSDDVFLGRDGSPSRPQHGNDDGGFGETALPVRPQYPSRKRLPHSTPSLVADGALYFITINCVPRNHNQLAYPAIASAISQSLLYLQEDGKLWVSLLMLMPDHLHGLFSFTHEVSMRRLIYDWKRFVARRNAITWQCDFFDHRIRNDASRDEKWHYIRNNPVRKGLVKTPDEWPFQWYDGLTASQPSDDVFG